MATWCPTCVGQAGAIKQVSSEYGNKLNVLVIDLWAPQSMAQSAQGRNAETANDLQALLRKMVVHNGWLHLILTEPP
jgi:thiol-disulfide isomerase/thioredoxin